MFLHWSWFLIAVLEINLRGREYSGFYWNALEYGALFAIVLLHEFGHALACRQVGGQANEIVLWPLGGVAYVAPPPRPGATLWSIAAGPLVNVVLAPVLILCFLLARGSGWAESMPNAYAFLRTVMAINLGLLIFNLLPIYPLDGGQILRSLLWFVLGRARSLMTASIVGFIGVGGLILLALYQRSVWLGILAAFIGINCWSGLVQARVLARVARLPRRNGFQCPVCLQPPVLGPFWHCQQCQRPFDTFETGAVCPHCGTQFPYTMCLDCGNVRPIQEWSPLPPVVGGS